MFNRPSILEPSAYICESESAVYKKQLRRNLQRQDERDMMTLAMLDNELHGLKYQSYFELNPELLALMPKRMQRKIRAEMKAMENSVWDSSRDGFQ